MDSTTLIATAVLVCVLSLSASASRASYPDMIAVGDPAEVAAIIALHDHWLAAYEGADTATLRQFYLEDTVLMPDERPTVRSWAEIEAFFAPGFERFEYKTTADLRRVEVSGTLAAAKGIVYVTLTDRHTGEVKERALRYLIVFRKDGAAGWRILWDMDNVDP